jgi:hypothetical protein
VAARAVLLEYDRRFEPSAAALGSFLFFDCFGPPLEAPGTLTQQCVWALCDPPFLSKEAMDGFCGAAAALLRPGGELLYASIPENLPSLCSISRRHRLGGVTELPFHPLQVGIAHRFRFFTTSAEDPGRALGRPNKQDAELLEAKEPGAVLDDVDLLFDGLKCAVISALTTNDDDEEDDEGAGCRA